VIVGTPQSEEAYGCMMRKDDADFKKVVDEAISQVEKSGEAAKIYAKWFEPDPAEGAEPELPAVRFDEEAVREPERQGARLTTPPLTQK
jgi:hypothetical protein